MPSWLDSSAYANAKSTPFLETELVFKKYKHSYFDYKEAKRVSVGFDTHMLVLSSFVAQGPPVLNSVMIDKIKNAFI